MLPPVTQMGSAAPLAPGDFQPARASFQLTDSAWKYLRPAAVLVIGLPILLWSISQSLDWIHRPFPGFFLMDNAVIPSVSGYRWPPNKAELFHSLVVAVDGNPVHSSADVYRHVATKPVGTPVVYTLISQGRELTLTLPTLEFTTTDYVQVYAILLIIAALSLLVGVAVGVLQPTTRQARVYLLLSFVGCLYASTAVFLHRPGFALMTAVYFFAESFFPAAFIHFALVFPSDRWSATRRVWPLAGYAFSAVLLTGVLIGFYRHPPQLSVLYVTYIFTALSFVVFLISVAHATWRSSDPRVQLRARAILPSVALGSPLTIIAWANNAIWSGSLPLQLGILFVPIFYLSVAYAVVKHDLFDIDRVVRQSFVYAVLSVIVLATYAGVLAIPARLLPTSVGESQTLLGMAFVVVLAFVLDPLRSFVQALVDRAFYRTRLDYRATISNLSEAMTTLLDLGEVVSQVTGVLTDAMHLETTAVWLFEDGERPGIVWSREAGAELTRRNSTADSRALAALFSKSSPWLDLSGVNESVSGELPHFVQRLLAESLNASLLLPLMTRSHPIGVLALGRKRSGHAFTSDDIELLRTLANQAAIAVQNARSYEALEELTRDLDAKVRRRTEELRLSNRELTQAYAELKATQSQLIQSEKMASLGQLVAGVAHELNNPASFVYGGLANLAEYVNRIVTILDAYREVAISDDRQVQRIEELKRSLRLDYLVRETPELIRVCFEGSERINKIVEDLRVFARADSGDRTPTVLKDGIESALRLLGTRLNRSGLTLRKAFADVPRVEGDAGQLNRVWMNLLANAIDAVEGKPDAEISVAVRPMATTSESGNGDSGWVEVEISDNGVGIAPNDVNKIFEPFFSTKPIGRGTGLGLSIAYGAVKSHGGVIVVSSEFGRGTSMTVRLPTRTVLNALPPAAPDDTRERSGRVDP
jgi:signal transduction histidine kinase